MADNKLRDFFQAMSNSAASNVSAPVDGINWLLRKAGMPVSSAPLMGSDWLQQKGLTRPVKQSAASLAGDTAGMLAPVLAATKAPQIANGLLQMVDNAMAPQAMNKQAGAVVWHGSPHKFDKFDASKIGTGEGAQAYGHGLYLAESPDVARAYIAPGLGQNMDIKLVNRISDELGTKDPKAVFDGVSSFIASAPKRPKVADMLQTEDDVRKVLEKSSFYKVDLPDEHIAKMINLDSPIEQAPQAVQDYYKRVGAYKPGLPLTDHMAIDKTAANEFKQAGITGLRYLDGGSRGTGAGTSNYVVFPGNESLLQILERNGSPVNALSRAIRK